MIKKYLFVLVGFIFLFVSAYIFADSKTLTVSGLGGGSCTVTLTCRPVSIIGNGISFSLATYCSASISRSQGYYDTGRPSCPTRCGRGGGLISRTYGPTFTSCGWSPRSISFGSNGYFGSTQIANCFFDSSQIWYGHTLRTARSYCPYTGDCPKEETSSP